MQKFNFRYNLEKIVFSNSFMGNFTAVGNLTKSSQNAYTCSVAFKDSSRDYRVNTLLPI